MITLEILTTFLGWCSVINIGVLFFSTFMVVLFRDLAVSIHSKMFDLDEAELPKLYFSYLASYKTATLVFNLAPYIALKIIL